MKISEYSIKLLGKAICGDATYTPYLTGYNLVLFFNKYGINDTYGEGFPPRWKYAEDKIRELNGTDLLRKIVEETVDPRRYHGFFFTADDAASQINEFLKFDKYELRKSGEIYKVTDLNGVIIQAETSKEINHSFINDQIEKCNKKVLDNDFSGAITNARSLIEAIFIEILERHENADVKNDGNIENQWARVKKVMKLDIDKATLPDYVIQILSGIDTAIKGLAGLSNNASDRHANKFITRKHHAKLAVNLAMTLSDFLIDSWEFRNKK